MCKHFLHKNRVTSFCSCSLIALLHTRITSSAGFHTCIMQKLEASPICKPRPTMMVSVSPGWVMTLLTTLASPTTSRWQPVKEASTAWSTVDHQPSTHGRQTSSTIPATSMPSYLLSSLSLFLSLSPSLLPLSLSPSPPPLFLSPPTSFCALGVNLSGRDNCDNLLSLTAGSEYRSEPRREWETGQNQLVLWKLHQVSATCTHTHE